VKPSRRLGYRFDVDFRADHSHLHIDLTNRGTLGVGLQARSLTVSGAPYSYTVGAGHELSAQLPNPGTYDLSLHGPNGFFRQFAGSRASTLRVQAQADHNGGRLRLRLSGTHRSGRHHQKVVKVVDAYGPDRHITLDHGAEVLVVDTRHSGGWYDLALTSPSDASFSYQLAGRLESAARLTSDPQLGRS
jgi:phospholipase C